MIDDVCTVRWLIVGLCVLSLGHAPVEAADYYVATNGSNSNPGTLAQPFLTIQQAAYAAHAGDNVYVRAGTYRETVTAMRSGTASAPITYQPYSGERVTVTGLDVVGSGWSPYSGSIYSTTVSGGASQLFVNGQMMTEARWPNAGYNNPLRAATSTISSASSQTPPTLLTITDSALAGTPDGTWNGATVAITPGEFRWSVLARPIQDQTGNTITYAAGADEISSSAFLPVAGNKYYIGGSLAALSAPKEYYYDSSTSKLYLQAPGNVDPGSQVVEARKRLVGFDLGSQNYVTVQGFSLKAATINIAGNHNTINNCQILYPTPYVAPTASKGASGVLIRGQYNTLRHSEVGYSWGDGVTITSSHNTVDNNVIHDVDWAGNEAGFVNTGPTPDSGGYNTITGNTMYNSGRQGITLNSSTNGGWTAGNSTANTVIQHNSISRYGRLTGDLGGIYAFDTDSPGTTIAYNRIDGGSAGGINAGIYLDQGANRMTVHHNLVTNGFMGVYAKGYSQNVFNNTLWGISNYAVVGDTTNTWDINTVNNLANLYDFDGTNVTNNRYQTVSQFTNSGAGDYTLTANSSGTNQGTTYKRAVDFGTPIAGITDGYTGAAPDAGAFEQGVTPWTAGADWKAWTAGNQATVPLGVAVYVTQSGTRTTTGSLMVGNTSSTSVNRRSFLQFDLSDIVSTTIASAVLRIYENTLPASAAGSVTLNRVTSAWTNANVSYNQSVDTVTPITGFYDPANLDLYTDINITAWAQGWLSNSATNYGLRLSGTEDVVGSAKYFDGFYGVTAPQLVVTFATPGDVNLDGRVDVLDLAVLAANYRKQVTGGWGQADFNYDGVVNVQDLAVLAANYRYGVASGVVPAYDGLDAAAIELLSQAGVTAVPEPCALVMLAAALLGAWAHAWRKQQ